MTQEPTWTDAQVRKLVEDLADLLVEGIPPGEREMQPLRDRKNGLIAAHRLLRQRASLIDTRLPEVLPLSPNDPKHLSL